MSASALIATGAALLAKAIAAARGIRYCSIGAMVGYGVAVLWPRPDAGRKATHPISKSVLRNFIVPLLLWCRLAPASLARPPNPRRAIAPTRRCAGRHGG